MTPPLVVTGAARCIPGQPLAGLALERREEPAVETALRACLHCLGEAKRERPFHGRVGLVFAVGSAIGEINTAHARVVSSHGPVSPLQFVYTTPNAVTARLGILLGLDGESLTLPQAAAPFWAAADLLRAGRCSMALVGGVAPAGPGWAAAVVSVKAQSSEQRQDQVARGRILLCAPGEGLLPLDVGEAGVASAVVEALSRECPVCIDCGPRGRIRAEPAIRSS